MDRNTHIPGRKTHPPGFTLIEILVVLAILAVALGVLAARGPTRSAALDVRGTATQLAAALRLTRTLAIARNQDSAFVLDLAAHAYRVADGPWKTLPRALDLGITAAATETAGSSQGGIRFGADGGSTGGRVRIAAGTLVRVVAVDWLSGRVTVSDGG